jgi:small multidrug resistance pump
MPWTLFVAIAAEVTGTLALKASDGFSRLLPSVVVVAGYGLSFFLLALTLKAMDVGRAYAVWAGLGTAGAALGGVLILGGRITPLAIVGMAIVIIGVVVLSIGGAHT